MANNNLNVSVTAGLDKPNSVAQINRDIRSIEAQLKRLRLQATIDGNAKAEIQKQITALSRQKRQLYIDLKLRQRDLKQQYKQAVAQIQSQPLNVAVDTSNAQRQMTGLSSSVRTASNETVTLASALRRVMTNAGLTISAQTALQYIRRIAQEATDALKEYDKYATNLSMITGGTKANSDNIIAELSDKSFEFKVDISELETAYETLLRTGKSADELDDYLKSTVYLSKIGFEDMETSAENLVSIANAYKLQSDEIQNVVSKLSALDTASITVAGKLATAMSKTAQSAQLAGLSIDELGAIIAGLRDSTGKTEDAVATSINSILSRLYNVKLGKYEIELEDGSTEDITESLNNVEKMLKTVGMNIRTSKGEFKDVTVIIDELVDKWEQLNDVQKNAIGFTFAGAHHKNTFIALVENWTAVKNLTDISADSAGQAEQKYSAYLQSIESRSVELSTAVKNMWNNLIPNDFAVNILEATTGLVQFTDNYKILQTALKSVAFYAIAKGIVSLKNGFIGLVSDIKNVSYAMNLASNASALSAQDFKNLKAVSGMLSDSQLKLVLSTKQLTYADKLNIVQTGNMTKAQAEQRLVTLGITQANQSAVASTFSLSGAFKTLWASISANSIGALTIAFTSLITIYQTVHRKQEEARQEIKDTAETTKELTDNIYSLYGAYIDMKIGVENGTESKENLTSATNNLLDVLGYEGEVVDRLIDKYGNLSNAINQVTADKLRESLPDLANAVNVELEEAVKEAMSKDTGSHLGFDITADNSADTELLKFIGKYNRQNGGVTFEAVNSLTTRIDFEGDRDSAEGIKQRIDNMQKLRQALFDEYGAENVQSLDFYTELSNRISELSTAYDEYAVAYSNYNNTAAQAEIIQSLIGKEIPKTVDEYKAYRQELIRSAENSGQFIGTQEDIITAIDGTISKMNEFSDIRNQTANRDTAYNMFGVDDIVNDANEGIKKAFINSLTDSELSVLIQLDKNVFDKGIEGVKQAIADFNNNPENVVDVETATETSSLEELQKAYDDISKSADGFVKNQKTVVSAFEEQDKHGQLSASSIRELSQSGYGEALVTDKITGAVTLNKQAYEKLNAQKQEKIRLDLLNEKSSLEDKLSDEEKAVSDLRQEYEALARADMESNAGRLSEITLELAKRGENISDISDLISQLNGDIASLNAPEFDGGESSDPHKEAFEKLYNKWQHDLAMNKVSQEEYINWLDGAYKEYFSDLSKYQEEYNKYEEEVYKARYEREQELFDKKIENYEKLADKALDKYVDGDGKSITVEGSFDYARSQINSAIEETQNRINTLSLSKGFEDEIDSLTESLEGLYDKLDDINKSEIESQKEYIESLKDEYSEMIDSQIDEQEKLAESIEKAYDDKISAIDRQIDAINKVSEAEERQKDILEAELEVKKAQQELDKAKAQKRLVYTKGGNWELRENKEAVSEAKTNLADAQSNLDKAKQESEISALEEQKEILETQKDNSKEYYDKVVEDLEEQKTDREKQYDILVDIYEQLGGDKKQTSNNDSLVAKLTANGDIDKAVKELTPTELTNAVKSGILTTDSNGNYAIDYSILDKNEQAVSDNTAEIAKAKAELEKLNGSLSNNGVNATDNVNPSAQFKSKANLDADGYLIGTDGRRILSDGKPIKAKTKSNFGGYGSVNNLVKAIQSGEFKYSSTTASQMMNNNITSRLGWNTIRPDISNLISSTTNSPVVNFNMTVEGSVDEKMIPTIKTEISKTLIEYTDYMTQSMETAFTRQMSK